MLLFSSNTTCQGGGGPFEMLELIISSNFVFQVVEIVDDEILLLTPAIPFNPDPFMESFTETKALKEFTLEPRYVCLNEELEFDFYDDGNIDEIDKGNDVKEDCDVTIDDVIESNDVDANANLDPRISACSSSSDIPPEIPPRDYSRHELNTSCNEEVYEEPVIPYGSPVYKLHPSLMRSQSD